MQKNITNWFRLAAPYIQAHRQKTFVLAFSGEVFAHANFKNLVHDIALLNSLGIRLILVFGIRPQISALLERQQHEQVIHDDWRVTDDMSLKSAQQAAGFVRSHIEALFSMGLPNTLFPSRSVTTVSGNFVIAKPFGIHNGVDYLHTGTVRKIQFDAIQQQLEQQHIVLLSPLGYSPTGEILNCKYEEVAFNTAMQIKADKLIYIGSENITDGQNNIIREITIDDYAELSHEINLSKELNNHLEAGIEAVKAGIDRVHCLSCVNDGALLEELFTREGDGTLICQAATTTLRPATIDDAASILALINPLYEKGILVKRTLEELEMDIQQFIVIEFEGAIIACASMTIFAEENMAELACIAVSHDHQKQQLARKMLAYFNEIAINENISNIFVLTTQASHWFEEQGFKKAELEDLPINKQALYNYQRNSQILIKQIIQ